MSKQKYSTQIYEKGDIVTNLSRKENYLILSYEDSDYPRYEYMCLKDIAFKDIFNRNFLTVKGSICSMPAETINRKYTLFEL